MTEKQKKMRTRILIVLALYTAVFAFDRLLLPDWLPEIARLLHALEMHELCVCDLAALLGVTKSAVSHQLKTLRLANLVKPRRDGQVVYYSLADDHVRAILNMGFEHIRE